MNNQSKGLYIVLEGSRCSGKTTQSDMLANRLRSEGYAVRQFHEPDGPTDLTARSIRLLIEDPHYQKNDRTELLLFNAARSEALDTIRQSRNNGVICVADRNYLSTLVDQYYGHGTVSNYEIIDHIMNYAVGDMQPDLTIILDAPSNICLDRCRNLGQDSHLKTDDIAFWERLRTGYLLEAKKRGYPIVSAVASPDKVHNVVWGLIHGKSYRQPKSANALTINTASAKPALLHKEGDSYTITDSGQAYLNEAVTNNDGNVYAFKSSFSPITAAAAMARLSRRFGDLRITLLDEFAGPGEENDLLKRVITAYGDDSVQQLGGVHLVVERASNLLTKKLEWGRLAAYLEQSTRYIYYDQKGPDNKYKYYVPKNLDKKTSQTYIKTMDQIFDKYSEMVHKATAYVSQNSHVPKKQQDAAWQAAIRAQACDAIRVVLPVATQSTVGIFASAQAIEAAIMRLLADELPEARTAGQAILEETRKVIPAFLERADKPERGGAIIAYQANRRKMIQKLANKYLPKQHSILEYDQKLVDVHPRNELDILADMIYEFSDLPLKEIQKEVEGWPYKQKVAVMQAYFGERLNRRHRPGRALEKIFYSWDIICDYGIFRDLQRHRMVNDLEWQRLTPRFGYEIPELVEKANLAEQFIDCFDLSLELYSAMQKAGYELEAQYATLMGHKMRWKVTYNAREAFHLHELRTTPQGHPGYRKLVNAMHEEVINVHPIIGEAMKFVNKDEDPELNRLAAERYAQYKLKILDRTKK